MHPSLLLTSHAITACLFLLSTMTAAAAAMKMGDVTKPCPLHTIISARQTMRQMIGAMHLIPLQPVANFAVDPHTLTGSLGVVNYRSFCPSESLNAARGPRQFCREAMRLQVDLSREPAVIFEAECHRDTARRRRPCAALGQPLKFLCANHYNLLTVRHRLCRQRGGRTVSEMLPWTYQHVPSGCRLTCRRPACT